jgi:N-methylhydantoinase B
MRHTTAGAGGYGDPRRRDPELVLADVIDGKVTAEGAERDYGVVVRKAPWRVDMEATARMRDR